MAFHFQTFRTRALTAIVFVLVMLAGLLVNQWTFLALFSVIHFGCWIEYQRLIKQIDPDYKEISAVHQYAIMLVGWGFILWMTGPEFTIGQWSLSDIGGYLALLGLLVFVVNEYFISKKILYQNTALSLFGFVYISLSIGLMIQLYGNFNHLVLEGFPDWMMPVVLIASIWINDTMAYIVGSFIGKTPFSPISPKKTWEGTIGGALIAVIAITLTGVYAWHIAAKPLLLISITAAVAGTLGDLLESKLKRMAGVKDSGQIMPGHGGFLDRFDSLLVATTVAWAIFRLVY